MCLALPALVKEILPDDNALVELGGVMKEISLSLVEDVKPGDYVIVHVGFALSKMNPDEAAKTLALFEEMATAVQADLAAHAP